MYHPNASQTYRLNQINTASPIDRLLMVYDAALVGCNQRDLERTVTAVNLLRDTLDYSYAPDFAMGLYQLYTYFGEMARKGEYEELAKMLRELRTTWAQAKTQMEATSAHTGMTHTQPAMGGLAYAVGM